jgi:hypothetical protein
MDWTAKASAEKTSVRVLVAPGPISRLAPGIKLEVFNGERAGPDQIVSAPKAMEFRLALPPHRMKRLCRVATEAASLWMTMLKILPETWLLSDHSCGQWKGVAVTVRVGVGVLVTVGVLVGVAVCVGVAVLVGVAVTVGEAVFVGVLVRVGVLVIVGVLEGVWLGVTVNVEVFVGVGLLVRVGMGVGVGGMPATSIWRIMVREVVKDTGMPGKSTSGAAGLK